MSGIRERRSHREELVAVSAGSCRLRGRPNLLSRIDELISRGVDFAFEMTLSGRAYKRILQRAHDRGYVVDLTFLWLPSADLALARVARRVELGGHGIPDEVVRRRFGAGIRNLFTVYMDVVDSWSLFDNSVHPTRLVAFQEHSVVSIIDQERYRAVVAMAEGGRDDG